MSTPPSDLNLLQERFPGAQARGCRSSQSCGGQVADVLIDTENVTAKVSAALRGLSDRAANDMLKKTLTELEQACEQQSAAAKSGPLKCEVVDLYEGGQYWLHKHHRYWDDVRLVFCPRA